MTGIRGILLAALLAPALAPAAEPAATRTDAPALKGHKLILVGDSTMAPNSGWGGAFCARHVKWKIACLNLARGARSTRSFRSEGAWDVALGEMKVPGYEAVYVLIQMGHNDQARPKPERWTEEATEYPANLRRFVEEARAAGALPILVTPLTRREFKDGKLDNTLGSWSAQVRKVAAELKVPLLDLNARSAQLVQRLGPVRSLDFAQLPPSPAERDAAARGTTLPPRPAPSAAPDDTAERPGTSGARGEIKPRFDHTHLGPQGAETFAAIVAEDLANAVPALAGLLIP